MSIRRLSSPNECFAVTYAIGDIHGRNDLLKILVEMIVVHRKTVQGRAKIVFLGDYIDRGPDPKGVLNTLRRRHLHTYFDEVILLKGNHELMLQESLERYDADNRQGVALELLQVRYKDVERVYGMSRSSVKRFLNRLSLFHSDGIRLFTHAGVRSALAIEECHEEDLLNYRGIVQDKEGRLVVHGHTNVVQPTYTKYALNIDTAAWRSGQLTCAVFEGNSRKASFLST